MRVCHLECRQSKCKKNRFTYLNSEYESEGTQYEENVGKKKNEDQSPKKPKKNNTMVSATESLELEESLQLKVLQAVTYEPLSYEASK